MSLQDAMKLEDLKHQAGAIYARRNEIIDSQRPKALIAALNEMAEYLKSQGFEVKYKQGANRGFTAVYREMEISAQSSGDDERLMGADYAIELIRDKTKLLVNLSVNRGTRIDPQRGTSTEQLIEDYENRLIPSLEALNDAELDGSYKLFVYTDFNSGKRTEVLDSGKAAVEKLF